MNNIGLDNNISKKIIIELNDLLANYQVFYSNVKAFHWNIKGDKFFELHTKFEEMYNDLFIKIDEVAERILTLGGTPEHKYSDYINISNIKEVEESSDGIKNVKSILNSLTIIISKQRNILKLSDTNSDEGTNSLMSDYIKEQEKLIWMYSSFLNE